MIRRRFGRTELQMPVLSCGGMRYQHGWKDLPMEEIPQDIQDNLEKTIRASVAHGVNHIETARGYGPSERQLGFVLPKLPREELIVQTKVGPCADGEEFRKNVKDSLGRLQLDHVELLGIHGINNEQTLHDSVKPGGCLEVARQLQEEGLVRHIGFSTHGPTDIIVKAVETDVYGGFDYINLHWYYIYQYNWPAIEAATKQDMGVFIISPTDKGGHLHTPTPKLVELTAPHHPIVFNDLFTLSEEKVHTISVGASKPSDFDLHMEAVKLLPNVDEVLPPILEKMQDAMDKAVGAEFARSYREGLPAWSDTPDDINIPMILWLWNLYRAYDMESYCQARYNLMGNADHWFPGNIATKVADLDLSEVLKDSPYAREIPQLLQDAHAKLHKEPEKRLSES